MTEELNNFNTDMKELFMNNKFEEIIDELNHKEEDDIRDLTYTNFDVVKKYYDLQKFDLLFTHIKFVAFTCFFCEYACKRGVIDEAEFNNMMAIYNSIHEMQTNQ